MFQLIELSQSTKTSERRAAGATVSRRVDPTFGEAIDALPNRLRDVVLLRDVDGMNVRTIATALGMGRAHAQVALQHARRAVRQRLLEQSAVNATAALGQP